MGKRLEALGKALEGVPGVQTVKDIFRQLQVPDVPMDWRVKGEPSPAKSALDSLEDGHRFYIGKLIRRGIWERVKQVLGFPVEERIYSEEMLVAALALAFEKVPAGKPVRFGIAPSLSELCNGPEDAAQALTVLEELNLLSALARQHFPKRVQDLELANLEEDELHRPLFEKMRRCLDEEGRVKVEEVCERPAQGLEDSLEIARILYAALQDSQHGEKLKHAFRSMVPEHFAAQVHPEDTKLSSYEAYGFFEVAIRLAELLKEGVHVHGGVTRQAKYDLCIAELVKGRKGKYKENAALVPLFDALEGQSFGHVYVPNNNLYQQRATRRRAWGRLGAWTCVGGLIAGTPYGAYRYGQAQVEAQNQAMSDDEVATRLEDIRCFMNGPVVQVNKLNKDYELNKKEDVIRFNAVLNAMSMHLAERYRIPDEVVEGATLLLQNYLLRNGSLICVDANGSYRDLLAHVDQFMEENRWYFARQGFPARQNPYVHFEKYKGQFQALIEADPNDLNSVSVPWLGGRVPLDPRDRSIEKELEVLGSAYVASGSYYELAAIPGEDALYARQLLFFANPGTIASKDAQWAWESGTVSRFGGRLEPFDNAYSQYDAREMALGLRELTWIYDAVPLREAEDRYESFSHATRPTLMHPPCDWQLDFSHLSEVLPPYVDTWMGEFEFELGVKFVASEHGHYYDLVARDLKNDPENPYYNCQAARKAACYFERAERKDFDFDMCMQRATH